MKSDRTTKAGTMTASMQVNLAKDVLTVRACDPFDARQPRDALAPLIQHYADLVQREGNLSPENIEKALWKHSERILRVVALSCGKDAEWVAHLSVPDGIELVATWAQINAQFLVRCATERLIAMDAVAQSERVH